MKPVRTILLRLLASLGAMLVPCIATAQDFPSRTIRIIVPSSPGPSLDIIARLTGQELAKVLGQNVIVENKPGANQQIGYDFVANSAPADGYTIAMVNAPGMATLPTTAKGLRFDPVKDFVPLLALGETRVTWAISSTYPWKTFAELVAYARANPGKLNFGTSSVNTRLASEALVRDLGLNATAIPYPAAGAYLQALISGEVHMGMVSAAGVAGVADRLRVLAITGDSRRPPYTDVPTFTELGFAQIRGVSFLLMVRSGTPKPAYDKLRAAGLQALKSPDLQARLAKVELDSSNDTPELMTKRIADEVTFFTGMGKKLGVVAE